MRISAPATAIASDTRIAAPLQTATVSLPSAPGLGLGAIVLALALSIPALLPARAGVQFENCVTGSDGSITCDTVPTGNTYFDDKAAQYGLLQQASPGWAEFNPYEGYDEDFGGGED